MHAPMLRFGRLWFGVALRFLPADLRRRAGRELVEVFEARQEEAYAAFGSRALPAVWWSELAGLASIGFGRSTASRRGLVPARGETLQDVRLAFRTMRRRPGLSMLAIVTCGLGIGGASAMFSVVNGVLLRPLPYPEPERVVSVYPTIEQWRDDPQLRSSYERGSFSYPEFAQWRQAQTSFVHAAGISGGGVLLTGSGRARGLQAGVTTWELFPMLGVRPVLGRTFDANEFGDTDADVVLISEGFWRSQLGGRADVIGTMLTLSDEPREIIGVLPAGFRVIGSEREVWFPRGGPADSTQLGNHDMRVVARLAPDMSLERAQAETGGILRNLSEQHADLTHDARVLPRLTDQTEQVRAPLLLLMGGSLLLLLAACVNFGALQLGGGMDRESELAVRGALGAGRGRLIRHLLAESGVLAVLGGALGVVLTSVLLRALVLIAPAGIPRITEASVDARVVMFALLVSLIAGIGFGLLPAVPLSQPDVANRLRAARTGSRARHRLHAALVVAQVALATVLLVAAGLLTRTLIALDRTDPGFRADSLLTMGASPLLSRFPAEDSAFAEAYNGYFDALTAEIEAIPGVAAVARTSVLSFSGDRQNNRVEPEGYQPAPGEQLSAERNVVSGNYLEMMGARLVDGRLLNPQDDRPGAALVVVISERMARRFWPGESALGRRLTFWAGTFTIVGVIEDVHDQSLEPDDAIRFYFPRGSTAQSASRFVIRVNDDPAAVAARIQDHLAQWDPDLATGSLLTMRERMANSLVEHRYRARLLACFAVLASLLAVSGIYGVVARKVRQRTHEIGVRLALGAPQVRVVSGVVTQGLRVTGLGILLGIIIALAASRVMRAYLHDVAPWDPITLVGITLLLCTAALLACVTPSLRAVRVDPIRALRAE